AVIALARALKAKGVTLSCDVGWDDTGEWNKGVFELMTYMDVFLMNETEGLHYTGLEQVEDSLEHMSAFSNHIVVKLGPKGAIAHKDGIRMHRPAYPVTAVDTTGAGDSFNAGYLYGFLNGLDTGTCLSYGNSCGALSVASYGGSGGAPDRAELEAFIRANQDQSVNQEVSS
ncbi:carbohydrate kinase family protein, partial [Paenibacillus sepulcri]|nr:carbohydrate kinase family protein [Paenibacillus sepulcri]